MTVEVRAEPVEHAAWQRPPLVEGEATFAAVTRTVSGVVERPKPPRAWYVAIAISSSLTVVLLGMVVYLISTGIGVWGNTSPVFWGWDIVNFVFWVGIAHAGTLISAILFLLRQRWRTSVNRAAEAMTLFAVVCAGMYPTIHVGRIWVAYWLFPIPNQMSMWPNFRSPLLWDVFAVSTYATVSLLFWYMGMVPDLATFRDRATSRVKRALYGFFALGWRGSARHWHRFERAYLLLAALATPLVQPPAQPSPTSTTFMGNTFVSGTTADLQSSPHPDDLERMTKHVAVARRNARLVLVSIHAHEIHRALDNPEPFVPTLAKACIDAGADVFITHGTHLVAGIEIYKGKPIFYGLGDFVFQFETVPGYAADVYQAYGLDPQALDPMEASAHVPLRGGRGLWETVVPRLRYDGERLLSVDVHPVTLGMDLPRAERGTPIAARPDDAERIVAGLAALSKGFGTEVRWTGAVGTVHL